MLSGSWANETSSGFGIVAIVGEHEHRVTFSSNYISYALDNDTKATFIKDS